MILSPDGGRVLSSLGWVDRDSLWQFDAAAGPPATIPLNSGAEYCSLHTRGGNRFAVAHHFKGRRFEITVRDVNAPGHPVAHVLIGDDQSRFTGDAAALADVPALYVTYMAYQPWKDYVLVELMPGGAVTIHGLPWYDTSYDKDYQAVIDAVAVPGARQALISMQRSSRLIVQDLDTDAVVKTFDIGGGLGNPKLTLRVDAGEIWTTDYDAVAVVTAGSWKVRKRTRLQAAAPGTQLFIGDLGFAPQQNLCIVARPYSHDVVGLDLTSLKVRGTATLGREPFAAAMLMNGEIIARDWKTGDLLRGSLERTP